MIKSINPTNLETLRTYQKMQPSEVYNIIDLTNTAFNSWRKTSFSQRSKLMTNAAAVLRKNKEEYSKLMTLEMVKPIIQSRAEVEKCALVCEYYADNSEKFLSDELISTDATKSFVTFQQLGIVLAVMPWDFPFWQVFRFATPGLMAGNAGILKLESNVSGCAWWIISTFWFVCTKFFKNTNL
jgi:succinate-semialdehyde dehydrogenase / glutarate-semialdehyde dehydrogenase